MDYGNKFKNHSMWKHENCVDAFFYVEHVKFDNNGRATLKGLWMVQGMENYWPASDRIRLNIKPEQYNKWKLYAPKGEIRYV